MCCSKQTLSNLLNCAVLFAAAGCPSASAPDPSQKAPAGVAATAPAVDTPAGDATFGSPAADSQKVGAVTTPETTTKPEPQSNAASKKVLLGSPALTAGIPGGGPLTVGEIEAWLAKAENHEPLEIQLPLGLAGAEPQISGLAENPLTRAKIELGRQLYFDTRLSADNSVSCASCHHPDEGYSRQTQFGIGIGGQIGGRNSPVSYNRILSAAQFWDGRAASLEEQAVGPIANAIEMGNSHDACVETVKKIEGYRLQFERVFGAEGVTIDTIGKALASFERVLVSGPSPHDYQERLRPYGRFSEEDFAEMKKDDPEDYARYEAILAEAKAHPMSESARRGRELFFSDRVGCTGCHAGANFTDEKYHNLGVGMDKQEPDLGRYAITNQDADRGAFKTPTVRNVALSAPYMHDGSQKTLEEVVEWYNKGGHPNPQLSQKVKKLNLTEQEKQDLVEFMKALTGPFPKVETGRLPE
jgi:cytochrome c peroxidase